MRIVFLVASFIIGVSSTAGADTCGNVDTAIATARETLRKTYVSTASRAEVSQTEIAQILSALVSYKLETVNLTPEERADLQQEHEGACSVL